MQEINLTSFEVDYIMVSMLYMADAINPSMESVMVSLCAAVNS